MTKRIENLLKDYERVAHVFPGASEKVEYVPRHPQRVIVVRRAPGRAILRFTSLAAAAIGLGIFLLAALVAHGIG
jgi:hypothetical protein